MRTAAPTRAPVAPARDNTRISRQIRRFALLWLISAAFVLVAITLAGYVSSGYRDEASARAKASTEAQLTVARLRAAIEQQANDRIAYDLTGAAAYFEAFQRHANTTARLAVELRRDMGAASGDEGEQRLLTTTLDDLERWLAATDSAMAASNRDRRAGLPPQHSPRVDATANALLEDLAQLDAQLPKQAARSIAGAGETADEVRLIRQVATLAGLILLLAGGIRLVRQAYGLAAEADLRREREERWREQMEAVLAWSVRAKSAATRNQLIGFANVAPRDALGATCFLVTEGAAPAHPSHGQPRLATEVDDAGAGLHVSVCFTDGRGDEHDHHALDLLLGHLSALWRTVLRQEELELAAGHDVLTGLPNRRTFESELRRRVALSRRRGLGFTLAMVDLDHFKLVNDSFGHPEGDAVLRRAGEAVRDSLRHSDRVFRVGGEEFALILETTDPGGVIELLERARESVKALGVEPQVGLRLSASIGWALYGEDTEERADLVKLADGALYAAKRAGRDRVLRADRLDAAA